ncbi:hypothetical protein T02_9078 [Trichinella nativa]|uniref:Uncharacterized protein n=1 Tax=Trichinella nativa TaxID=6335 RepID=A0A0V1L295_9BILA|nr:hypothetical protein T02_9078 [Trichinella nativa]
MEKRAVLAQRSAEETKPIPAIYDEEASAASAEPSTSGHFPLFRRVRAAMYGHRAKRRSQLAESEDHSSSSRGDGVTFSARVKISTGLITGSVRSLILVEPAGS